MRGAEKLKHGDMIVRAKNLILAGARLTTVRSLLGISEKESCQIYAEAKYHRPSTGSVPSSINSYLEKPLHQLHASVMYIKFLAEQQANPAMPVDEMLIRAYSEYEKAFQHRSYHEYDILDIDRSWLVIKAVADRGAFFKRCPCGAHFISGSAVATGKCPICSTLKKTTCTCCEQSFYLQTLFPKRTPGRHSGACPTCKKSGAKPKRKQNLSGMSAW